MSGGGRRPRPYYPNQKFRHHENAGYNFSSDVDVGNANGSFYYGTPRPMHQGPSYKRGPQHHGGYSSQQHRGGGGGGYSPQYRGGGSFSPQYRGGYGGYGGYNRGGYEQRGRGGYRPPQRYMGRFPRRGGMMGHSPNPYNRPKGMADGDESEDPFYNNFMFEDPWKNLIPSDDYRDEDNFMESEKVEGGGGGGEGDVLKDAMVENRTDITGGEGTEKSMEGVVVVEGAEGDKIDTLGGEEVAKNDEVVGESNGDGGQEDGGIVKDKEDEVMEDTNLQEQSTAGE